MTTELTIQIGDSEGQDQGRKYLAWLGANNLVQTKENLMAFVAGWALASEIHPISITRKPDVTQ